MRGDAWGLLRRVDALCAIAGVTGDASLLDEASATLEGRPNTELIEYLERMIGEARHAIADAEESDE